MLSKNIFFYWGSEPLSFLRYSSIYSFKKFNPEWRVVLLKSRASSKRFRNDAGYSGKDFFPQLFPQVEVRYLLSEISDALGEVQKADLLKWMMLAKEGGIACDADVLFFKPITGERGERSGRVFNGVLDSDVGLIQFDGNPKKDYVPVSFVSGTPNKFFQELLQAAQEKIRSGNLEDYECLGSKLIEEKFGGIEEIKRAFPELRVTRLPSRLVFPFSETTSPWIEYGEQAFEKTVELPDESIGLHWYAGSTQARLFNNSVTEENYGEFNCTVARILESIYR